LELCSENEDIISIEEESEPIMSSELTKKLKPLDNKREELMDKKNSFEAEEIFMHGPNNSSSNKD